MDVELTLPLEVEKDVRSREQDISFLLSSKSITEMGGSAHAEQEDAAVLKVCPAKVLRKIFLSAFHTIPFFWSMLKKHTIPVHSIIINR